MADAEREAVLREFAEKAGLAFNDWTLLDQALTHASVTNDDPNDKNHYETLEFLGDAALELAVSHTLFQRIPDGTPGEHTQMRSRIVRKSSLAAIARQLNLGSVVRLGRGEEQSGGRERNALLADCVESLLAAIYLDRGWAAAQDFVATYFEDRIEEVINSSRQLDFRSLLQNYCQREKIDLPEFFVISEEGPAHQKVFEVEVRLRGESVGSGRGRSKKEAEQVAARQALIREGVESTE